MFDEKLEPQSSNGTADSMESKLHVKYDHTAGWSCCLEKQTIGFVIFDRIMMDNVIKQHQDNYSGMAIQLEDA